jgi:hypothetical protein
MFGEIAEPPNHADYGITEKQGEGLARLCHIEFERKQLAKVKERGQMKLF